MSDEGGGRGPHGHAADAGGAAASPCSSAACARSNDVSFGLPEGEIIGLIGPNGAGKTTLFNCLTGLYTPTSGTVVAARHGSCPRTRRWSPRQGVARTFQNIRLFPSMTAAENVLVGRHVRMKQSPLSSLLHGPGLPQQRGRGARSAPRSCWSSSGSRRFADELARNLPYGDQRRLEIARALATDPAVLLLDEPTAGHERPGDRGHPAADLQDPRPRHLGRRDRARHQVHLHPVRPGARARAGRAARGGHARTRCAATPGWSRPTSALRPRRSRRSSTRRVHRAPPWEDSRELPRGPRPDRRLRRDPGRARRVVHVEQGQIVSLIGSNGAGKTTTLRTISGLLRAGVGRGAAGRRADPPAARARDPAPRGGAQPRGPAAVRADDRGGEPAPRRVHPQRRGGHPSRTWTASTSCSRCWGSGGRTRRACSPAASSRCSRSGRAMMSRPKLLMLDEPSMGLSPIMTQKIFDDGQGAAGRGHHGAAGRAERAVGAGAVGPRLRDRPGRAPRCRAPGRELLADPRVQEAYLGEGVAS